jgi:hypothetical protein
VRRHVLVRDRGGDDDQDSERRRRMWEALQIAEDERCVMIADDWEHGVNCSWGGECPIVERR